MLSSLFSALPILMPLIFIVGAEFAFVRSLRRRDGAFDFFELGVLYSVMVFMYCIFPAIEYLSGGLSFSVLGEFRLFQAQPSPAQLAPVFWYYAMYLACFVFSYTKFRGIESGEKSQAPRLDRRILWGLVGGYACTYAFFAIVTTVWHLESAETYGDTYLLYNGLPAALQQLANHMVGVAVLLQLFLMAFLTLDYPRYKRYILFWLLAEFVSIARFGVGSRTGLMVLLLSFVITYNRFVKRLSMRMVVSAGLALLFLFAGLGIARALSSSSDDPAFYLLGSGNEFDNLFANAYDLKQLKEAGQTAEIFPRFYFADLARMVPEQLAPGGQIDPSQWYVQSFYPAYAERGGGFAFGAISECIVGMGWIDVIWRGLLVGWVFGSLHHLFVTREKTFWNYAFYLWATVFSYQTFRVTTFNLLPRALSLVFIWWCVKLLMGRFQPSQRAAPGCNPDSLIPTR
jgi:hypothetical protein